MDQASAMIRIEPACKADAHAIAAIYAHHVTHGTASYETIPPTVDEMARRIAHLNEAGWPWLVARDGTSSILGYAYASQFRDRAAYRFTCVDSIYVRHDQHRRGLGKALLSALLDAATACEFRQMVAVIGGAAPASQALHAACGFTLAGCLRSIGRKHGRWLDTLYMQRALGPGADELPPFEP